MREDPPDALAAMVEFFYKGAYSLPYVISQIPAAEMNNDSVPSNEASTSSAQSGSQSMAIRPRTTPPSEGNTRSEVYEEQQAHRTQGAQVFLRGLESEPADVMLFHLEVWRIGEYVECEPLQRFAGQQFAALLLKQWEKPQFLKAVEKIYDLTDAINFSDGEHMRALVVQVVLDHLPHFFSGMNSAFDALLQDVPSFAVDIAKSTIQAHPDLPQHSINKKAFYCINCTLTGEVDKAIRFSDNTCPRCDRPNTIRKCGQITGAKKVFSCKNPNNNCTFAFETVSWDWAQKDLRCPMSNCRWTGPKEMWEQVRA